LSLSELDLFRPDPDGHIARAAREAARFAAWLLALWPDAIDLSMVYGDSTFLAAAAASLYYMRRGDNGRACLCAAVAIAVLAKALIVIVALIAIFFGFMLARELIAFRGRF